MSKFALRQSAHCSRNADRVAHLHAAILLRGQPRGKGSDRAGGFDPLRCDRMSAMSPADTLERLAASALASTSWAATFLQGGSEPPRPLSETAPTLVQGLRRLLATVTPERLHAIDPQRAEMAARILRQTLDNMRPFLALAQRLGHAQDAWFHAATEALDDIENIVEGLGLSLDEDFRRITADAIAELDASRRPGQKPPDWRSSLASMSD